MASTRCPSLHIPTSVPFNPDHWLRVWSLASEARSWRPQLARLMRYSWFIIIANHGPSAFDCPPALNANVIFDIRLFLRASVTVRKIHREFADSVSQKYENQVSSCSLISIAGRHTQDVTSTRAGGMYSQSVVFPRLAVIQSAKWKDRNGLWFGFRIIHYAAHNTPSPATAVLHTQSGRD
ncbi:hypothetical protein ALC53_14157 [Atta colombica]|uniref:Uncharacterized protein n=1 Tax=Atta colombica TaxID=520822 RepID=A0A195ATE3_9HYME|nr:hypothetical protein ALC53_14157 [Atta colombica]